MCGLWGTYHQTTLDHSQRQILWDMFRVGVVRGHHGTGIVAIDNKDNMAWRKVGGEPYHMYWTEKFDEWIKKVLNDSRYIFGHHRAATKGEVNDDNAHPFQHGHITLAHNGTLTGGVQLKDGQVDSDALAKLVADEGAREAFGKVVGPYACIWWDSKQNRLNFIKNSGRPLSIWKARGNHFWASEAGMLEWLLKRHYTTLEDKDIVKYNIENDKIYYLDGKDTLQVELEPVKKKWSSPAKQTYTYPQGTTQTQVTPLPKPSIGKVHKDFLADFYLLTEEMKTYANGIVRWKYLGMTEDNENILLNNDEPLRDWKDMKYHATLRTPPRVNYSKLIDPSQDEQAVFYEADAKTLIELKEEDKPKGRYNTRDNFPLSKNKMKRLMRDGCITCKASIFEHEITKCLAFTTHEGDPKALFCPKCSDAAIKRTEKNKLVVVDNKQGNS